jgi:hypothetical protein
LALHLNELIVCNVHVHDQGGTMCPLPAFDVRSVFCVVGLLAAIGSAELLAQPPSRPRVPPWEIEPTDETKRRMKDLKVWAFDAGDPQIVISARLGESRVINFRLPPMSIQFQDPGKAIVTRNEKGKVFLHGLAVGITTMTVVYPSQEAGREDEMIRYLIRVHVDE